VRKAIGLLIFVICLVGISAFTLAQYDAQEMMMSPLYVPLWSDSTFTDSTSAVHDTVAVYTVKDSTYLNQLTYHRVDSPVPDVAPTSNPLYLKSPSVIQREVKLDSTGRYVIIREMMNGKDIKIPIKMPLEEYIKQRSQADFRQNFQEMIAKESEGKKKKSDLGDILGQFTNIDIPVPANPVFSIFGPPRINLVISGAVDIRAAFRTTTQDQSTISVYGSTRNEPDFAQEVQINVNGTIGDKLNILADWNTQRTFEYENQLRIKYTGYEDEIVQSVEAGNVSLATSSSFISSSSALFGIKAGFQIGPLKLTAIASQKKGQIQEKSITGGSQTVEFTVRAWEYSKDHYFIDTVYIPFYEEYIKNRTLVFPQGQIKENEYEVWITDNTQVDIEKLREATAVTSLPPYAPNDTTYARLRSISETSTWRMLEPNKDYKLNLDAGVISFNRQIEGQAVAIAYKIENGPGTADDITYGTLTKNETQKTRLVLKLIKPRSLLPQDTIAWRLMLKNIYSLKARKIEKTGFDLNINYEEPGKDPVDVLSSQKIVRIFGLDEYDEGGGKNPDQKFDFNVGQTIDPERGELIFPSLFPFTTGLKEALKKYGFPDSAYNFYRYDSLYDVLPSEAQKNSSKDRFVIRGQTTAGTSSTISLGFNVVEGSVQVLLDGRVLTPNVDYTVDYIIGQVIIRNQAALVPGANLQIKYEQNDLFQLASKTLLGTRGEVNVSEKTKFGFTVMNLDQQTLSDKVRLGEEPINNTIYGFDGQTSGEVPFLTKALDALPFFDTKTKSEFTLRGEAAYMSPDPNTKKSTIPDDKGAGIAYIDDFEGAKRIIPLSLGYGTWHDLSAPAYQFNVDSSLNNTIADTVKMFSKARTFWYNPPQPELIRNIYGLDQNGEPIKRVGRNEQITTLVANYNPKFRGKYNYSLNLRQTLLAEPKKNWGGLQRAISLTPLNLVQENVNFIEIWVKVTKGSIDTTKKLFIDLGAISEDVIPNRKYDTEDKLPVRNGILNEGEDTGIDGLTDDQERQQFASFLEANKPYNDSIPDPTSDPSGDNWEYSQSNFEKINGEENNKNSEIGKLPDTEDLNRNNSTDLVNSYFEFELPLDTTANNPYRVGGGYLPAGATTAWYQYRIPLTDYKYKIGSPDLSLIEYARLWFTGHDEEFEIHISEFNLIGNQWEELKKNDSTFKVSVVNIEDNYNQGYRSPSGVIREKDRTKPDEDVLGNEQSLALNFFNLKDGESREAIKRYSYRPLDVFSYREMKMFVHGEDDFATSASNATAKVFLRFGADSTNYYEYKAPVYPGWDDRNNVRIRFADLTAIKQGRDSVNVRVVKPVPDGPEGSTYAVLGNPTLTKIAYISIGVENPVIPNQPGDPITGQIWVNELRLTDVDDTPGWAYSFSTTVKLADLGSVAFNYSKTDPYFHNLESRFGGRVTSQSWNLSANVALDLFLPQDWAGSSFPFSYSHSEALQKPLYMPSSDIVVDEAANRQKEIVTQKTNSEQKGEQEKQRILSEVQTLTITETYAMPSFKLNVPSNFWLLRDFFNKITYGFNYTTSTHRSPTVFLQTSWQWNARIGYSYTFDPNNYIQPFGLFEGVFLFNELKDLRLYYIPITNISTDLSMVRSRSNQRLRQQTGVINPVRSLSASRNMSFGWKLTEGGLLNLSGDYSVGISSSLVHLEVDRFGKQRTFQEILEKMLFRDQFINFGFDNGYNQSFNVNSRPRVPAIFELNKYMTLSARYGVSYRWQNNLQQGDLGIGTGWGNNISLSTDFSLKSFVETWFPKQQESTGLQQTPSQQQGRRGRDEDEQAMQQENQNQEVQSQEQRSDTTKAQPQKSPGGGLIGIARTFIKTPFFDYEKVNISFTQTNSSSNNGVPGRPGFANFFGRVPFIQQSDKSFGPSRAYQLGLVTTPSANITDIFIKPQFPFIGFSTDASKQIRARNANLSDAFTQSNKVTLRTNRDLWSGARIDLNWNVGWDYSRTQTLRTDSLGRPTIVSGATGGSIERSFMSLPPTFIFSMFKSGIEDVGKKYSELAGNTSDTRSNDAKLSQAFEEGFETFPIFKRIFGEFLPRVNYSLRWDGLEQLGMFKNFATRVSLDHAYQSSFRRTFDGSGGTEVTKSLRISYGFSPLAGVNITFKEVLKGNMSANVRYGSSVNYDLTPSSKNIIESVSKELSLTASYARTGFEIPLFGLALQNDIDISFTYSYSKNSRTTYEVNPDGASLNTKGTPGEGSSRTQMEPRVRYVLSSRVTASVFYRYTSIKPDEAGSRIPGSSTNEGGLDVHIAIQ
jgi:cell surface protein SprA